MDWKLRKTDEKHAGTSTLQTCCQITLISQAEVQRNASCSAKSPKKRELSEDWKGLVAWSVSFSMFIAVIASKHPEKPQELLAYHATVLIEALRFGCKLSALKDCLYVIWQQVCHADVLSFENFCHQLCWNEWEALPQRESRYRRDNGFSRLAPSRIDDRTRVLCQTRSSGYIFNYK